jgi:glycosyltransferase involved in cell wall biosynthesis
MKNNLIINEYDKEKIRKIYPFLDLQDRNQHDLHKLNCNRHEGLPVILFVGQIIRGKGLDLLISALSFVKEKFHLKIIGKGNDKDFIKTIIKKKKLVGKVSFFDWTDKPEAFYKDAAVIVIPSRWQEPFGLIGIEAFSYKKPVIGFNVGGISEWLKNNRNGYLIEPFDLKDMGEKIKDLLNNSNKRKTFGESGYKMIKDKYSKEIYIKSFLNLFSELENV